ncbi:hypothetical protein B0I35DRAFT_359428 [Stachybotrys elegans]|uniref:Aminoglycoside phosphotransferase domain-containing protein n=1 Tax=Stachybotrys elegans TaxID=80388 RepID=A0A8K0SHF4_9HYPO|nr:hypothetical protein B0I35DRAFT_359428 [Stachybotrys elegans]
MASNAEVEAALSLIDSQELPYPSDEILRSFVQQALHPILAARYISDRLQRDLASAVVSDWSFIITALMRNGRPPPAPDAAVKKEIWARDAGQCCITGKKGSLWDPLPVLPVLPVPSAWVTTQNPHVHDMLGAFFTPQYRDWWLWYAEHPDQTLPHQSHWLVCTSAARAFADGHVKLDRQLPSMTEYEVNPVYVGPPVKLGTRGRFALLGDHSRLCLLMKIDPRFIGTHARFAAGLRYLDVAADISADNLSRPPATQNRDLLQRSCERPLFAQDTTPPSRLGLVGRLFFFIWRRLPNAFRLSAYGLLKDLAKRYYAERDTPAVQSLPFGLYLKEHEEPEVCRNEFNAMQTIRQHTTVPAPIPLDMAVDFTEDHDIFTSKSYILMSKVPGYPLHRCYRLMQDSDHAQLADAMKGYINQLRSIPKVTSSETAIYNTLGGPCRDNRVRSGTPVGPFADEAAFSHMLPFPDDPGRSGHMITFTHADLNPRNILVDRSIRPDGSRCWKITGIVDWETAGYWPEYWDLTKAMFEGFRWSKRYNDRFVKATFAPLGDYTQELDVETRSWEIGDGI